MISTLSMRVYIYIYIYIYLEWLANMVVVEKKSGKWRLRVDITDLNKAYPKDPFPVPRIE